MDYSLLMNPNSRVLIQQNINFQYMITDKFGYHIFWGYSIDKSKSPILPSTQIRHISEQEFIII